MPVTFDRILITVPDLEAAEEEYRLLLGVESFAPAAAGDKATEAWLPLPNTIIALVQSGDDAAHISGLVFGSPESSEQDQAVANAGGLDLRRCDGRRSSGIRAGSAAIDAGGITVDHLVLRTRDADDCVQLFGTELGLRLALDQTVPEWGGRMLFFRAGKMTLEVIESSKDKPAADHFWGIAYQCQNLQQTADRLSRLNIGLSAVRAGRKTGSLVATVKTHCLGIPTLLIQQP